MNAMMRRLFLFAVLAGAALIAGAAPARADFKLRVFDDGVFAHETSIPTGAGFNFFNTGLINTTNFQFLASATSNSPGDLVSGNIQNLAISVRNTKAISHELTMVLTDQNFTNPGTTLLVLRSTATTTFGVAGFGGGTVAGDKVQFTSYANTDNKQFASNNSPLTAPGQTGNAANTTTSDTIQFTSAGVNNSTFSGEAPDKLFTRNVPYSLSNKIVLTLAGGSAASVTGNTNVLASVPAPGNLALLLAGLPAAAAWWRRRRTAK